MKNLIVTFSLLLVISFVPNTRAANFAQTRSQTPESVIKEFYKWYIKYTESGLDPYKKGKITLKKYVTLRLFKQNAKEEAKGMNADDDPDGADYFVQNQELDEAWATSTKVSKVSIKGNIATAIVNFGTLDNPRVLVTLIKEGATWKIDKVKNASR